MTLTAAKSEFIARVGELRSFCTTGSAWVFVCAAAFLDYLAKLTDGENRGRQGYIDFINKWLSQIRPGYKDFRYIGGETDLPIQMYHVLRCGIVHSLSLIPDQQARDKGGRDRSIALCHRAESIEKGLPHLSCYSSGAIKDAVLFVAEDFLDDIESVIKNIFEKADNDPKLKSNISTWLSQHPLITGGY
jgi:hypothetical protein